MIVTHKYLGIPVFFLILFCMFIVTFGPIGEGLKGWVEMVINEVLAANLLAALASMVVAPWALDLVNTVIDQTFADCPFPTDAENLRLFADLTIK